MSTKLYWVAGCTVAVLGLAVYGVAGERATTEEAQALLEKAVKAV